MSTPPPPLTSEQLAYLEGLKSGDVHQSGLQARNVLTNPDRVELADNYQTDADRFSAFLAFKGQLHPSATALAMRIPKQQLIDLLTHFKDKNCLLQTNCFGFTKSVKNKGEIILISRGSFWQSAPKITDELVWGKFLVEEQVVKSYGDLDLTKPLRNSVAQRYIQNFLKIYPDLGANAIHGYLFPVKAMLTLLNDPAAFGPETYLRLSWGLITYNPLNHVPGNFSLLIQADDASQNGFVLEFRTTNIAPNDGDCPPKAPCNPPPPSSN